MLPAGAAVPPNVTAVAPPKFTPASVTAVPPAAAPVGGVTPETIGSDGGAVTIHPPRRARLMIAANSRLPVDGFSRENVVAIVATVLPFARAIFRVPDWKHWR